MTKQEHDLIMTLFGIQFHYLLAMGEALESADLILPHDVGAFLEMAKTHKPAEAFRKVYCDLAAQLGVVV